MEHLSIKEIYSLLSGDYDDISRVCKNNGCRCQHYSTLFKNITENGILRMEVDKDVIQKFSLENVFNLMTSMKDAYSKFLKDHYFNGDMIKLCDDFCLEYVRFLHEHVKWDIDLVRDYFGKLECGNLYEDIDKVANFCELIFDGITKCKCGKDFYNKGQHELCNECLNKSKLLSKCCKQEINVELCMTAYPTLPNCADCKKIIDIYELIDDLLK